MKVPDLLVFYFAFWTNCTRNAILLKKLEKLLFCNSTLTSIDFIPHQLDTRIRELSLVYLDMVVCEALTYQMMLQVLCISTCS